MDINLRMTMAAIHIFLRYPGSLERDCFHAGRVPCRWDYCILDPTPPAPRGLGSLREWSWRKYCCARYYKAKQQMDFPEGHRHNNTKATRTKTEWTNFRSLRALNVNEVPNRRCQSSSKTEIFHVPVDTRRNQLNVETNRYSWLVFRPFYPCSDGLYSTTVLCNFSCKCSYRIRSIRFRSESGKHKSLPTVLAILSYIYRKNQISISSYSGSHHLFNLIDGT